MMPSKVLFFVLLCLMGCSGSTSPLDPNLPVETQWQADLAFLVDRLEGTHPDLYHSVGRADFEAARERLNERIPSLQDDEVFVELLRLLALVGSERDGHMALSYFEGTGFGILPLQFYRFADGVFVVDAQPEYAHLVGQRLTGIGGRSLAEVDALIDPLISRDNQSSLEGYRNLTYATPAILAVLEIVNDRDAPTYDFTSEAGETSEVVRPVPPNQYGLESIHQIPTPSNPPLYLTRRAETFWLEHLVEERVVYLRLNEVRPTSGSEDLAAFGNRVLGIVNAGDVERVIVDLRQNLGGNNQLIGSILSFLGDPRIDREGGLIVFTDRHTFSAAGNLVAAIGAETSAIFAGVSPGGSGSQYGDVERFDLPYSGLAAFIPTRHWVFGDPSSQGVQHPMDVTIEPEATDFFQGRDPVLEHYTGAPAAPGRNASHPGG